MRAFWHGLTRAAQEAQQRRPPRRVYFVTSADAQQKANAAVLVGALAVLHLGRSAEEAYRPLTAAKPFAPFRDASCGPSTYHLTVLDCLRGLALFAERGPNLFVKGRRYGRPLGDVVFTIGMSFFETMLLGKGLWDINAQPTMFPRAFYQSWVSPPHDFSLDLFAYFQARRAGLSIRRFPVRFGARAHGVSSWNVNWAAKRKFIRRTVDFSLQLKNALKP